MAEHQLICPFLDQSVEFARGVEFGLLVSRMKRARAIADYFLRCNQEQIMLAANRLSWKVVKMKPEGDWIWIRMKRRPQRQEDGAEG